MRDLVGTIILLGLLQGAVLAVVLWRRSANRLPNRILATLVALVALMLLLGDLEHRFAFRGHPHFLGLGAPLPFLFAPLMYLYASALTRPLVRFDPRWLVHALPFAAFVLYMAQVFYLKGEGEKLALARMSVSGEAPASFHLVNGLEVVQAFSYLAVTWRALARYGDKMQGYFSELGGLDLRWLKILVLAHVGVWSAVLVITVLRGFGQSSRPFVAVVQLGSALVIFLTGYVSLWQPELAQKATAAKVVEEEPAKEPEPPAPEPTPAPPPPKYQRNRLDDEEARELVTKLESLMDEKQLYREPGLTLPTLADALGVTPHMLSQLLNVRVGRSFFVFVNAYRAEALKKSLTDPANAGRGVLELAFEVGFSSKSTLNSFFKKHTGMTPTEFRGRGRAPKIAEDSRV